MEIVKKNLLSIIAGVIALLAVVFYFWPRSSMEREGKRASTPALPWNGKWMRCSSANASFRR